jgi:hypothetical protein
MQPKYPMEGEAQFFLPFQLENQSFRPLTSNVCYEITGPGSYTLEVSRYDDKSKTMVSFKALTLKIGP